MRYFVLDWLITNFSKSKVSASKSTFGSAPLQVNNTLVGTGLSSIKQINSSLYSVCFAGKAYTSNSAVCPIFISIWDLGSKNGVFWSPAFSPFLGCFAPFAFGSGFSPKLGSVDCPGI